MTEALWEPEYTERAKKFWADYRATHDVTERKGQAVGIDPMSGQVWFGRSILDIMEQQELLGEAAPLYFIRVGFTYYGRKGVRR